MLRRIRTNLAAVTFMLITLLFLDFTGTLHHWLSWLSKIQFLPAVMALNVVVPQVALACLAYSSSFLLSNASNPSLVISFTPNAFIPTARSIRFSMCSFFKFNSSIC